MFGQRTAKLRALQLHEVTCEFHSSRGHGMKSSVFAAVLLLATASLARAENRVTLPHYACENPNEAIDP